jgi:hypothetical protein
MMPIDTRLDGNPATLYAGSQYLRARLGFEVNGSASTLRAAGDEARHEWLGSAGAAFSDRMGAAAARADALRAEIDATALTFSQYADMLAGAQTTMIVARQIAASGGLIVAGTTILDPFSPDPVTHQRQRLAYALALQQVSQARTMMVTARTIAQARQSQAQARPRIQPTDVVGGPGGRGAPKPPAETTTARVEAHGAEKPAAQQGPPTGHTGGAPKPPADGVPVSGGAAKPDGLHFAPEVERDPALLGHEAAHVPQQGGGPIIPAETR